MNKINNEAWMRVYPCVQWRGGRAGGIGMNLAVVGETERTK